MKAPILAGWHVLVVGGNGKVSQWANCDECHTGGCLASLSMDACTRREGHERCHGFHAARDPVNDPEGWERMFAGLRVWGSGRIAIPGSAIGLHLRTGRISRVLVVDADGEEGMRTLRKLMKDRANTPLPETLTATSPSGGCHLFYLVDEKGPPLRTRPRGIGPGVDLKADGGYVVLPPAPKRRWELGPGSVEPAPCPAWLLKLSEDSRNPGARRTGYHDEAESYLTGGPNERNALRESYQEALTRLGDMSPNSGRNTAMYNLACRLYFLVHLGGITRAEADAPLWSAARKCGLADSSSNIRQTERSLQSAWDWTRTVNSRNPQE